MKTQKLKDKAKSANAATANETTESATITEKTMVKLADFAENPDNPSTATEEEIARLAGKLKRVPLGLTAMRIAYVTDRTDGDLTGRKVVISGNKRLRCLKAAFGEDGECPAEWFADVTAMSEAERHEFIVSANVSDGSWDLDKLLAQYDRAELGELMGAEAIDKLLEGVDSADATEGLTDEDAVPEVSQEPKSRRGAVYQLGRHRVMCGDSTSEEDVKKLMGGGMADMVFTDPPWNVAYGTNIQKGNHQGNKARTILNDKMTTDDFHDFMNKVFDRLINASKKGAPTYVVMSAQEWGNLMLSLKDAGYHWSSTIIWAKDRLVLSRKDYHTQYEPIWYGWQDGVPRLVEVEDRKQSDLWEIPRPSKSDDHPTMKPVELVERAINNSSRTGNLILDLFGGSGTTIIASEKSGRVCYSMELDPKYCDVIRRRWAEFAHGEGCDWEKLTTEVED